MRRIPRLVLLSTILLLTVSPALAAKEKLVKVKFKASEADPAATQALFDQRAFFDRRVPALGRLAVFLHGAGVSKSCGPAAHLRLLAGMGFHVFSPCYVSGYGVENCGDNIGGCRKEAFDGIDGHDFIDIARADSIEGRLAKGLEHLAKLYPEDGWEGFLNALGEPSWERVTLSGHSHGASTAALIGRLRNVDRIIMLAGPYDRGQPWYDLEPVTKPDRHYGLSHLGDKQNEGHLTGFEALQLPGEVVNVDDNDPPYDHSHRLVTEVTSKKPHSAVRAGNVSPKVGDSFVLEPAWRYLYGVAN